MIAHPVGKAGRVRRQGAWDAARRSGYRLGVSAYETGINPSAGFDTFALRRLAVERYTTVGMFKSMLAFPQILS